MFLKHKTIYAILYRIMIGRYPKYTIGIISKNPNRLQRIINNEDEKYMDTSIVQVVGIMQQKYYFSIHHAINKLQKSIKSINNDSEQFA